MFIEFHIVVKGRNFRKEESTVEFEKEITGLEPEMSYAVNVFLVDISGKENNCFIIKIPCKKCCPFPLSKLKAELFGTGHSCSYVCIN